MHIATCMGSEGVKTGPANTEDHHLHGKFNTHGHGVAQHIVRTVVRRVDVDGKIDATTHPPIQTTTSIENSGRSRVAARGLSAMFYTPKYTTDQHGG